MPPRSNSLLEINTSNSKGFSHRNISSAKNKNLSSCKNSIRILNTEGDEYEDETVLSKQIKLP